MQRDPLEIGLVLAALLLAGCNDGDESPFPVPFEVIAHSPGVLATNADPAGPITVSFSKAVDEATLTEDAIELLDALGPVEATLAYDEPRRRVAVLPSSPLAAGEAYEIRVSGQIASTTGDRLPAPLVWQFFTACDGPHPVPDATWRFASAGGDSLTVIKICSGIIARGSIRCSIVRLLETAIGRMDAGNSFAASDATVVSSFLVSGQFTEQDPGVWCLAGMVDVQVIEFPHPPTSCHTRRTIREHCTPGTEGVLE